MSSLIPSFDSQSILKTYVHQGQEVQIPFTSQAFFNATVAAKPFGKRPADWLRTDDTKAYIEAITRKCVIKQNQLVVVMQGAPDTGGGTWLHPKLGIVFARWLNPDFAVWADEQIDLLLRGDKPALMTEAVPDPAALTALQMAPLALEAAKAFGFSGNHASLSADRYIKTATGISVLAYMGQAYLPADPRGLTYTVTELGQRLDPPIEARWFNQLLKWGGYQIKDGRRWKPTDKAARLCEWVDVGKVHGGAPVKQLRWFEPILTEPDFATQIAAHRRAWRQAQLDVRKALEIRPAAG